MERKIVERRTVLKGGAAAVGMLGSGASTAMVAGRRAGICRYAAVVSFRIKF